MTSKICGFSDHVPIKVNRGHKPSIVICEICGKKLKLIKKNKPKSDQGSLFNAPETP